METLDKATILADFWLLHDGDTAWSEFFAYNDLAMPYSFGVAFGHIAELSPDGEALIDETFSVLCDALGVSPDDDWDTLEPIILRINDED